MENIIKVRGARQHNLKNVNVDIPKNKLVVFTGVSGSGKSSLAFDTIYAEGQRRYVESLSAYARQFLGIMSKPDVDTIEGLSPAISIEQKTTSHNPRSTVGTVTEIYDYLRLLFARVGHPHCPICGREIAQQTQDSVVNGILHLIKEALAKHHVARFLVLSPVVRDRKGEFSNLFESLRAKGYTRVRVDGRVYELSEDFILIKTNKHKIDVVVDRISLDKSQLRGKVAEENLRSRLSDSIEQALGLSEGLVVVSEVLDKGFSVPERPQNMHDHLFSEHFACPVDNISLPELEPRMFSFNSPHGACQKCFGIGTLMEIDPDRLLNPRLSTEEGGILPLASSFENDTWFARLVRTVAEENGFSTKIQLGNLSRTKLKLLLHGTGETSYQVFGTNRFGRETQIVETFPGIINELERRYSETDSEYVRREIERYMVQRVCPSCNGARLRPEALSVTVDRRSISDVTELPINDALEFVKYLQGSKTPLSPREQEIARLILKEIAARVSFLVSVGLEYLTLNRPAETLAGGESQRIRLASQIGSGLTGVLYVLDEPTVGLHQRDNKRLIQTLKSLRDLGNTVVVVEHDREMMESSDWILDFGPGPGKHGGIIVAQGTVADILKDKNSVTSKYLSGKHNLFVRKGLPYKKEALVGESVNLIGASEHNLKDLVVKFPLGKFICITGVSGSGKSTLLVDTLYPALRHELDGEFFGRRATYEKAGTYKNLAGIEGITRVSLIDQSPIGRTPRSNPATYTGVFSDIRALFAQASESRIRGYKPGRFSFNVKGGRCEACEGQGVNKIEMQFLSDVYITCDVCNGSRYGRETLEVEWHGKNIADVLHLTVEEAREFFQNIPAISGKLQTLLDVGLGYIELGQSAPTLSGGEAQRVKLAAELGKRSGGTTFYILDEPTTGLHFADLEKLVVVLRRLVEMGNTVTVIEHNLDVIKNADWIIDLGPEGGEAGGEIVAQGTPQDVSKNKKSYTGQFLAQIM
ncbi:MAG: excinuclease ABC subunit UvrA [Candidatus Blackburnbacteria bacterium]|nr:excinuclease ABC subunit UvrA [Candidatus Blackburnbacteria bacterium]